MNALLIDIGNTRIKWRVASVDRESATPRWSSDERALATQDVSTIADAFAQLGPDVAVDGVFLSNVAGSAVACDVLDAASRCWPAAAIHTLQPRASQCGVENGYRDPARLGPDRWLALIGARVAVPDRTLLVCSFGTATTIDLLAVADGRAVFTGGLILPGFDAMRAALSSSTARLPLADGRPVDFADNTDDAITGGIVAAQLGAVERSLRIARDAMGPTSRPLNCLLAGGGAAHVAALLADLDVPFAVVHDLVLRGIAAVASETVHSAHPRSTATATPH